MTARTERITAEKLLKMPDDGTRRELVGGLGETTPAGDEHGYPALRMASRLERHVDADTVRAPDLAVEVVSPNDKHSEVLDEALDRFEAGCRMVLVVSPGRRAVTVYRSREDIRTPTAEAGDAVDGADVAPGWRLDVAGTFA